MPFKNNEWKPNPKQSLFLQIPDNIKEGFYGGGANSGKSEVLLAYPLIRGWYKHPQFKQVFMRRTHADLKREIVPRSREFYLKFGAKLNKQDMIWTFPREDQYGAGTNPDGAMIFLGHCENEDDVHIYDSMEISLFTPDELTSFTEWIYTYIGFTRVRSSVPELPAIIRAAGMPGNIGHTWVKNRFVLPDPKGNKILIGKGGNKRIYIHSTLADNPYGDPNYSQSLDALPEAERQAKKFGSWDSYLGQVFDEFRDRHHPDEPENALHVIEPFNREDTISYGIPDWWPKLIAIDWGYAPPAATSIIYGAVSPDSKVIIFREDWFQKEKIEIWASKVKHIFDKLEPKIVKLCQSAGKQLGQEHTIYEQISSALDRSIELTSNSAGSRVSGKMLLHEYFRWKPKQLIGKEHQTYNQDFADWLLRNKTQEDYEAYLDTFKIPKTETNLPKLVIFDHCTHLIDAIRACTYSKSNPQDVEEFAGDDPYDAVRYLIDAVDRFFEESKGELRKLSAREELSRQLQITNDMTAYYRNARKLEKEDEVDESAIPIRRYHPGALR